MDSYLLDTIIGALGLGVGAFGVIAAQKIKAVDIPDPLVLTKEAEDHSDIPHIEIDGKMVPHPTVMSRRHLNG